MELDRIVIHKSCNEVIPIRIIKTDEQYTEVFDDLGKYKYPTYEANELFLMPNRVFELLYD